MGVLDTIIKKKISKFNEGYVMSRDQAAYQLTQTIRLRSNEADAVIAEMIKEHKAERVSRDRVRFL